MAIVSRILLMILLLCSQGMSVCFDKSGHSYVSDPVLQSLAGDEGSPCHCPCDDDECEEHELKLDAMPGDSVEVPPVPCVSLPPDFSVLPNLEELLAASGQSEVRFDHPEELTHASRLRKTLMSCVVLRI
ncbi:MAG: hypothetical protein ACSHX7_00060 [Luteolibacter sp.]